jgi:hypothetical protein
LKLTWHSSACVAFESSNTKVLFDPWLSQPAFLGSWQQWPPPESALNVVLSTKFDYIVYTHFHSDHWDAKFLKEYLDKWSKDGYRPIILIASNSWHQLSKSISDIARDRADIVLLKSGKKYSLNSNDFEITSWVSDYCDPLACGKLLPCFESESNFRAIDSVSLIKDKDFSVLNLNDAVVSNIDTHLEAAGIKADLVMGVFGAAGSFPQCMSNLSNEVKEFEKNRFMQNALSRLVLASERLKAKYIFPFAGQYILSGRLSNLNEFRAIVPVSEASTDLRKMTDKEILTLSTNESTIFEKGKVSEMGNEYSEPSNETKIEYLEAKNLKYPYEMRPLEKVDARDLLKNLEYASQKLANVYNSMKKIDYTILIEASNSDLVWNLHFADELRVSQNKTTSDEYSKITLDLRLLDGCVRRKSNFQGFTSMHWNQAHIGSHLTFNQTSYNSTAHYLLNFLHT